VGGHEAVLAEAAVLLLLLHGVLVSDTAAAAVGVVWGIELLVVGVHVGVEVVGVAVWGFATIALEAVVHEVAILHATGTGAGDGHLAKGRVELVLVAKAVGVEAAGLEAAAVGVDRLLGAAVWWGDVVVVVAPAALLLRVVLWGWWLGWTGWGVCEGTVGGLLTVNKVVVLVGVGV
jgi:hypothetical protein